MTLAVVPAGTAAAQGWGEWPGREPAGDDIQQQLQQLGEPLPAVLGV